MFVKVSVVTEKSIVSFNNQSVTESSKLLLFTRTALLLQYKGMQQIILLKVADLEIDNALSTATKLQHMYQ